MPSSDLCPRLSRRPVVAIYARVSAADQSCDIQLTELNEYARHHGWAASYVFKDEGVSGAKGSRPALDKLLDAASRKEFDLVLVTKVDRWGRSVQHLSESVHRLDSYGVRFICIQQGIDTDRSNPTSRLMFHMLAAFAEFERSMIRERTAAGQANYRKRHAAGLSVQSKSGKNLPVGRPVKVFPRWRIHELRSQGLSWGAVAEELGVTVVTVRKAARALEPVSLKD